MNELKKLDENKLRNHIYTIRGSQVMLDSHLAALYEVKPRRLREQVKRNIGRFPEDFMFQLTEQETDYMVSQNAIPSKQHLGGSLPFVFTEQGVANISSVLTSERAIEVNIRIMRAFVAMRKIIVSNSLIYQRLDNVEKKQIEHDKKFELVFNAMEDKNIKPDNGIFFDGQVFDAYKLVSDIIEAANNSIVLFDNYVNTSVLTLFSKRKKGVDVKIYTRDISKQLRLDVEKFNVQYGPIEAVKFERCHDRFLIIDDKEIYHIGASLKDLGKKVFAFSKFDKDVFRLLEKVQITSKEC